MNTTLRLIAISVLINAGYQCLQAQPAAPNQPVAKTIVLPTLRSFRHPSKILTLSNDGETTIRMVSKADNNNMLFMAEFIIKDFSVKGKRPSTSDFGILTFVTRRDGWDRVNPSKITLIIDGRPLEFESEKTGEVLYATCKLDVFSSLLAAKKISVKIESIQFDLEERHIEALRDLASRLPVGKTTQGGYVIEQKPDAAAEDNTDLADANDDAEFQRLIATLKKERLASFDDQIKKIKKSKLELKQAMIADDEQAISTTKQSLEQMKKQLLATINEPLSEKPLNLQKLEVGQIGWLFGARLIASQILDKKSGEALISTKFHVPSVLFKVKGVDLTNMVDDKDFSSQLAFVVVGTYTYKTVGGGSNTIFELRGCKLDDVFTADDLKESREIANEQTAIILTAEEESSVKAARENKKAKIAASEANMKSRRAQSFVDSGKLLLKKNNYSGARKQFEKAIAEAPDSAAAKEAAELIEKLP